MKMIGLKVVFSFTSFGYLSALYTQLYNIIAFSIFFFVVVAVSRNIVHRTHICTGHIIFIVGASRKCSALSSLLNSQAFSLYRCHRSLCILRFRASDGFFLLVPDIVRAATVCCAMCYIAADVVSFQWPHSILNFESNVNKHQQQRTHTHHHRTKHHWN